MARKNYEMLKMTLAYQAIEASDSIQLEELPDIWFTNGYIYLWQVLFQLFFGYIMK